VTDAATSLRARAHDNLVMWTRVFAAHNDARTATDANLFMASLPFEYAGFRTAVPIGPTTAASTDAALAFFAGDPDAFVLYARPEVDTELTRDGVVELFQPPQMVCAARVADPEPIDGLTIHLTDSREHLHGYAAVTGAAFADLNFPSEQTAAALDRPSLLDDARVALAVAERDGHVVAGAISVTEAGGCYVSFVAADRDARRQGAGDAVTRLVTNAGFDAGATFASLEASPFGLHVYERMGFQEIRKYALLVAFPPR
jgi:ribosomal protein S18 acetylase RimI-like enzyme